MQNLRIHGDRHAASNWCAFCLHLDCFELGWPLDAMMHDCLGAHLKRCGAEEYPCLRKTLDDVVHLAERKSFVSALKHFGEFRIAVERHINLEDKSLLPIIERVAGPTEAINQCRTEHATIRRLLNAESNALSAESLPELMDAHRQLSVAFSQHWQAEERLLNAELRTPDEKALEEIASALSRS